MIHTQRQYVPYGWHGQGCRNDPSAHGRSRCRGRATCHVPWPHCHRRTCFPAQLAERTGVCCRSQLQLHLNRRGHVDERHDNCRAGAGAAEKSTTIEDVDEETDPDAYCVFRDELTDFAIDLAKLVVRDGEGPTKFVEVCVEVCVLRSIHTETYTDTNLIVNKQNAASYTVSTSALVKTALYGEDAK